MFSNDKEFSVPEIKPAETMGAKAAAAMRAGIKLRPRQCFGTMTIHDNDSCALQALRDGGFRFSRAIAFLHEPAKCPVGCRNNAVGTANYDADGYRVDRADVIVHLNDLHKWPRERIAEWVEKL